ncbi:MAG: nucleotidyltransferase, partial [Anaerolineae bacterium]|nr:nucleotidyltransferase [Anaerolineae bacterium]
DKHGFLLDVREHTHITKAGGKIQSQESDGTWTQLQADTIVSLNMWGFTASLFSELASRFPLFLEEAGKNNLSAEFFLPNVVGDLIIENKARVKVLQSSEQWIGVTYKQDKERVKNAINVLVARGDYPANLWRPSYARRP